MIRYNCDHCSQPIPTPERIGIKATAGPLKSVEADLCPGCASALSAWIGSPPAADLVGRPVVVETAAKEATPTSPPAPKPKGSGRSPRPRPGA